MEKRGVAILGSTGSIGTQALEVIKAHPELFSVEVLVANNNIELLAEQVKIFQPNVVVIANESFYPQLSEMLRDEPVKVFAGAESIEQVVEMKSIQIVLTAMVGYAGLIPTIRAIEAGKHIALANKETLVVAGELITRKAAEKGVNILPVDSEHSAIFQCLAGEYGNAIEKIYLTASGGPFLGKSRSFLTSVTKEQALKHPNWEMGQKITIDSATLMNKGLEVIEARWLFGLKPEQIDVIIHPQSVIHSIVQFEDGSMKAQMGLPDMKLPIQYALGYPFRIKSDFPRFNFLDYPQLSFEKPDLSLFRNLSLAYEAMRKGGNMPCVLNAANEVAVEAFLKDKIPFLQMPELIEKVMQLVDFVMCPDMDCYIHTDREARCYAEEAIGQFVV
jgi:1-deoxy-D-xylulose-5-phosphate reductoisomerase